MGFIILSRRLRPDEEKIYRNRGIIPKTSRFAIDGIALITGKDNIDSNITVEQVISILKRNWIPEEKVWYLTTLIQAR